MDSNEHGAMEQNEEQHESNISIYYTRETELYAESYDAKNMCIYCKIFMTWKISEGERKVNRFDARLDLAGTSSGSTRPP